MALGDQTKERLARKKAGFLALLKNWAGVLETYAKTNRPWTDRTAHARQGLNADAEDIDGKNYVLYLAHGVEYGVFLEEGTKPHEIRPRNKKALYWPGASHPVKRVKHPGSRPYAIIIPTIDYHINRIRESIVEYWSD